MNTNRNSDLRVPSGFEVESASLHMPVEGGQVELAAPKSGMRGKLDLVKSKAVALRSSGLDRMHSLTSNVRGRVTNLGPSMNRSLHGNPAKWAGIAAGAGLGLGLLGRMLRHRMAHSRAVPSLVIIETSC